MVICKFYLQGTCRYGSSCKFEHSYNSKYSYHAPKPNSQPQTQLVNVTSEDHFISQVRADIQSVLKGGQWLLSCYGPNKDKPNFPGLAELSFEEARLFIYEARANNNLEQAVTYMNNLVKEAQRKHEQILQQTPAILNTLLSIYKGEQPASPFGQSGSFGPSNNASSVFRSALQNKSVFGQNQSTNPASVFAQANQAASVFGQANQNASNAASVFGQANQNASNAASVFGQANQNMGFGQQSANAASIFGQANQSVNNQASSIFAQANQNNASGSVFGQPFPTSPEPKSIFAQANQNAFASTSPFATNEAPKSIFGQANQNLPQNSENVFQTGQTSGFGNSPFASQPGRSFAQQGQQVPLDIYSNMEDLSESDIEAYKSDSFELGFIPDLPPPREVCV